MEISKIIIGAMRFKDRKSAIAVIRHAIDSGFNYVDTSPVYCNESEAENSEAWVGEAVHFQDYRSRVMVSAKCTPGNGGLEIGLEFQPSVGFGVRSASQLQQVFNQSLKRQKESRFDYYHLWTTHTMEQIKEALKSGGWHDGVMQLKDKWGTLGITTHADTPTILEFLKTGHFKTLTIPLNVVNRTRVAVLDYCDKNNITVIAMNPLAGGFLASNDKLKELALRYLMSLSKVRVLIGFSSIEEVDYAKWILDTSNNYNKSTEEIIAEVDSVIDSKEPRCTACGYCAPCPQNINVGASLSYYNLYKYAKMDSAREAFKEKQWEDGLRLDKCIECGICSSRCPNALPLKKILADAREVMYK
jgi:predicted aldo/keto reductase-like oxidoreductase